MYPENNSTAMPQLAGNGTSPYPGKHELAKESRLPVSEQEKALAELHGLIDELADRMQAVLLPERDDPKGALATLAEPSGSMLGMQLKGNNNQIFRASNRVRDLIERLDV